MSKTTNKMIRVRAIVPVVGAYPCSADQADHVQSILKEDDNGNLVTGRAAFKKFKLACAVERPANPNDISNDAERLAAGDPPNVVDGVFRSEADECELPESYVAESQLVERGLVEVIEAAPAKSPAPVRKVKAA